MKPITFEGLQPTYRRFFLGEMETEYRKSGRIEMEVLEDNSASIFIDGSNMHGLQESDLHDGQYKTPYFAYKHFTQYESPERAIEAFNKWLSHREVNLTTTTGVDHAEK